MKNSRIEGETYDEYCRLRDVRWRKEDAESNAALLKAFAAIRDKCTDQDNRSRIDVIMSYHIGQIRKSMK